MKRVTISFPWPLTAEETKGLLLFAFEVSLTSYLSFFLIEQFIPGFVTFYFNLNSILYITVVLGVLVSVWSTSYEQNHVRRSKKDVLISVGLGIVGSIIIFTKVRDLGFSAYIIALASFFLIVAVSLVLWSENQEAEK